MSSEWETTEFQRFSLIASFMTEIEMLEDHISSTGTSQKNNLIALGIPVYTFMQASSIYNV